MSTLLWRKGKLSALLHTYVPLELSSKTLHKGQCGRLLVVGGSNYYTGAPYFSAMAALRMGVDMAAIVCTPSAGIPIKSYSPELIVYPILDSSNEVLFASSEFVKENIATRFHVFVIGPGLGKDPLTQECVKYFFKCAQQNDIPLVIDADGLELLRYNPELVNDIPLYVMTPNAVEFSRFGIPIVKGDCLEKWFRENIIEVISDNEDFVVNPNVSQVVVLSERFANSTVLVKGQYDMIGTRTANHNRTVINGSDSKTTKRSGGQGDILSGCVGAMLAFMETLEKHSKGELDGEPGIAGFRAYPGITAAACASVLTREAAKKTFLKYGRGMLTTHMLDEIQPALDELMNLSDMTTTYRHDNNIDTTTT